MLINISQVESFYMRKNYKNVCSNMVPSKFIVKAVSNEAQYRISSIEQVLLSEIESTERGVTATPDKKVIIDKYIKELSESYSTCALEDNNLFGYYNVSYVGTGKSQYGNPAGGSFRGIIGRILYKNEGLFQHLIKENDGNITVVNYVYGKLFRIIPLGVILKGIVKKLSESMRLDLVQQYGTVLSPGGTVMAMFDSPKLVIGDMSSKIRGFSINLGPKSSVVLDTPYVSNNVRLGVGSRGSVFVFQKTNVPMADKWRDAYKYSSISGKKVGTISSLIGVILLSLNHALIQQNWFIKKIPKSISLFFICFGSFLFLTRGGIED
jgi:hypothetical protein